MHRKIHFVGIGGYGMSSLARILLEMGYEVTGSDMKDSPRLQQLGKLGAKVTVGHNVGNIGDADLVVVTNAVSQDNVEVVRAKELGIPVVSRAEFLGSLMKDRFSIAVTGSHGKTTTTAMIATVLIDAGLDPTTLIGAEISNLGIGARFGKSRYMVVEADEAYGSFLKMYPTIAVVTNVDNDHLDYYGNVETLIQAFRTFLLNLPQDGCAVLCADDARLREIMQDLPRRIVSFGLKQPVEFTADSISTLGFGSRFSVRRGSQELGSVSLNVPGLHNISNALACIAVSMELGIDFKKVASSLEGFRAAKRRCQLIDEVGGVMIVDDYAHHPTEIMATLAALRHGANRRILAVFQPQRYTRTGLLMYQFARAFSDADKIFITEIYSDGTGESPIPGVSGERLAQAVREYEKREVFFSPNFSDLISKILQIVKPGDLVVTMGAGDIWKAGLRLAEMLKRNRFSVRGNHSGI